MNMIIYDYKNGVVINTLVGARIYMGDGVKKGGSKFVIS